MVEVIVVQESNEISLGFFDAIVSGNMGSSIVCVKAMHKDLGVSTVVVIQNLISQFVI